MRNPHTHPHASEPAEAHRIARLRERDRRRGQRRGLAWLFGRLAATIRGKSRLLGYWLNLRILRKPAVRKSALFHDLFCDPLTNPPTTSAARAAHMRDADDILGVVWNGEARAYPWWIMDNHHVSNDRLGGEWILVTLCEACSSGNAYLASIHGQRHTFENTHIAKGTISISDHQTWSVWGPNDGRCIEGPLKGTALTRIPLYQTTWEEWKGLYPGTTVVVEDEASRLGHGSNEWPGRLRIGHYFRLSAGDVGSGLPPNELVLGVVSGATACAYPLRAVRGLGGVVNAELGGEPLVVFGSPRGTILTIAFSRRVGDRVLEFERSDERLPLRDRQTGSGWNFEGKAVEGPLSGAALPFVDSHVGEWYVWRAYHPETQIFEWERAEVEPAPPLCALDETTARGRRPPAPLPGPWPWEGGGEPPVEPLLSLSRVMEASSGRALEIHAGTGALTLALARRGHAAVGVDLSPERLAAARRRAIESGAPAHFVAADPRALPFRPRSFSRLVDRQAFHGASFPQCAEIAREVVRVTDSGGWVQILTPTRNAQRRRPRLLARLRRAFSGRAPAADTPQGLQRFFGATFQMRLIEDVATRGRSGQSMTLRHCLMRKK